VILAEIILRLIAVLVPFVIDWLRIRENKSEECTHASEPQKRDD